MYIKKYDLNGLRAKNMPLFTIAGAIRAVSAGRATVRRALKSEQLSATTDEQGEQVSDLVERLRVFEPLKGNEPVEPIASSYAKPRNEADPRKKKPGCW